MTRSRILLITRNLPPLVGGMEQLNWHLAEELAKKADVHVIGPKGAAALKPLSVTLHEVPLTPLPLFLLAAFLKGFWVAFRRKPDVILAGSGLTAPTTWLIGKLFSTSSAAYLHGFDITANNALYRKLWRPFFRKLDQVIVNSTPTQELAIAAGVCRSKIRIVHPGVSLPETPQSEESISAFKAQHGLAGKNVLLSVGRLTTRKGLREFIGRALPSIVDAEPETILIVIGGTPKNSLGAGTQTVESIQAEAKLSGVAGNVRFLGVITDRTQLATAYEAADVHVFPVRHIPDDPEGFGMVAIEAAAHGVPTVAFATGGVVDAVLHGSSGYLVARNNYQELSTRILQVLQQPQDMERIREFARQFAWENFGKNMSGVLAIHHQNHKQERQAHAVTDLASRTLKAKKIELLLGLDQLDKRNVIRVLEVGCGSGGITHYFATHPELRCEVTGVDIQDNRQVIDGYKFLKVDSVELPFSDSSFDVVISNHVIEHVGGAGDQLQHIKEIRRVLAPGGVCYLAVPNRWMLTEPHYNLKFLSWLPRNMRSRYLRLTGKGKYYDCEPLELAELEKILTRAGLCFENISIPATKVTFDLEKPHSIATKLLRKLPAPWLGPFKPIIPTLIYKLEPKHE